MKAAAEGMVCAVSARTVPERPNGDKSTEEKGIFPKASCCMTLAQSGQAHTHGVPMECSGRKFGGTAKRSVKFYVFEMGCSKRKMFFHDWFRFIIPKIGQVVAPFSGEGRLPEHH